MIGRNIFVFCKHPERIENYAKALADPKFVWHCHHRREVTDMMSAKELKEKGLYYDVEPEDLILLAPTDHSILHNTHRSIATRKKISNALKGRIFTESHRKKISENAKTRIGSKNSNYGNRGENNPLYGTHQTEEHRKKIAESRKGKFWFNNGITMTFCFECPDGFVKGRLKIKKGSL